MYILRKQLNESQKRSRSCCKSLSLIINLCLSTHTSFMNHTLASQAIANWKRPHWFVSSITSISFGCSLCGISTTAWCQLFLNRHKTKKKKNFPAKQSAASFLMFFFCSSLKKITASVDCVWVRNCNFFWFWCWFYVHPGANLISFHNCGVFGVAAVCIYDFHNVVFAILM